MPEMTYITYVPDCHVMKAVLLWGIVPPQHTFHSNIQHPCTKCKGFITDISNTYLIERHVLLTLQWKAKFRHSLLPMQQLISSFLVHTVSADRTRREQRTATRHRLCDWSSYIASLTAAGSKLFIIGTLILIGLFESILFIINNYSSIMSMRTTTLQALHVHNRFRFFFFFFFSTHLVTESRRCKFRFVVLSFT